MYHGHQYSGLKKYKPMKTETNYEIIEKLHIINHYYSIINARPYNIISKSWKKKQIKRCTIQVNHNQNYYYNLWY